MQKQASAGRAGAKHRLTGHPVLRVAFLVLSVLVGFVALRGSSAGSNGQAATDPRVFTGKYLSVGFGALMGSGSPDDVMKLYTPACRQGKNADAVRQSVQLSQRAAAGGTHPRIEGVELGDGFEVAPTQTGYAVTVPDSRNIRLLINGTWVTAHDQLVSLDLEQADSEAEPGHLTLEYVEGKLLVASC